MTESRAPALPHDAPAGPSWQATLHVRDTCLCLHTQRAARMLARRFDKALRPSGLTSGQFSLLMALNRPEPPSVLDVAATLAMDRTTVTAMLKPLERRGLARSEVHLADRRTRLLTLTREGRATLAAALPIWQAVHAKIEEGMEEAGADHIRAGLKLLAT